MSRTMIRSFNAYAIGLAAIALLLAIPSTARAGYPDGLNTYAGYHILHGSVDPYGLSTSDDSVSAVDDATSGLNNAGRIDHAEEVGNIIAGGIRETAPPVGKSGPVSEPHKVKTPVDAPGRLKGGIDNHPSAGSGLKDIVPPKKVPAGVSSRMPSTGGQIVRGLAKGGALNAPAIVYDAIMADVADETIGLGLKITRCRKWQIKFAIMYGQGILERPLPRAYLIKGYVAVRIQKRRGVGATRHCFIESWYWDPKDGNKRKVLIPEIVGSGERCKINCCFFKNAKADPK